MTVMYKKPQAHTVRYASKLQRLQQEHQKRETENVCTKQDIRWWWLEECLELVLSVSCTVANEPIK